MYAIWRKIDRPQKNGFVMRNIVSNLFWVQHWCNFADFQGLAKPSRVLSSEKIKKHCFLKKPFTCQLDLGVGCCWFAWRTGRRFRPSVPPWPSHVRWQTGWSKPPHPDPPYQPSSRLSSTSQGLKIRSVKKGQSIKVCSSLQRYFIYLRKLLG